LENCNALFPGITAEVKRLLKWIAKGEDTIVGKGGAVKIYHSDVSGPVGTRCYPKIENLGIRVKAGRTEHNLISRKLNFVTANLDFIWNLIPLLRNRASTRPDSRKPTLR